MQLGFCMWLDRYGGVWVQLARGARCDIGAFYTALIASGDFAKLHIYLIIVLLIISIRVSN